MKPIPTPCNCEYREQMFLDIQKVWLKYHKKNEVMANDFVYTMIQLGTFYLKKANHSEQEILDFAEQAIKSIQLEYENVESTTEREVKSKLG